MWKDNKLEVYLFISATKLSRVTPENFKFTVYVHVRFLQQGTFFRLSWDFLDNGLKLIRLKCFKIVLIWCLNQTQRLYKSTLTSEEKKKTKHKKFYLCLF